MGRQVNFNIGIIGCGLVGYKRSRSLGLKGKLVACADLNINRAKKLASNKKIKIYFFENTPKGIIFELNFLISEVK